MSVLLVLVGGAIGAPLRHLVDRRVQSRRPSTFPWGTLLVNTSGSLLLGLIAGLAAQLPPWAVTLVGTGVCGAFTTYSTFSFETVRLLERGAYAAGLANIALSLPLGLGAFALGWWAVT